MLVFTQNFSYNPGFVIGEALVVLKMLSSPGLRRYVTNFLQILLFESTGLSIGPLYILLVLYEDKKLEMFSWTGIVLVFRFFFNQFLIDISVFQM